MPTLAAHPFTANATSPAEPSAARAHFEALLSLETDCWDVHAAMDSGNAGFILLDVRSPEAYRLGHVLAPSTFRTGRSRSETWLHFPQMPSSSSTAADPIAMVRTAVRSSWPSSTEA